MHSCSCAKARNWTRENLIRERRCERKKRKETGRAGESESRKEEWIESRAAESTRESSQVLPKHGRITNARVFALGNRVQRQMDDEEKSRCRRKP